MSHFDTAAPFRARLAHGFEGNLASDLNSATRRWAERVGFDAVIG